MGVHNKKRFEHICRLGEVTVVGDEKTLHVYIHMSKFVYIYMYIYTNRVETFLSVY